MGSQPRFPGWLLGSCWDSPRELTLDRGPGGSVGAAPPPPDLDSGFPRALGCNRRLLPTLPPCKRGNKWSLTILRGHPLEEVETLSHLGFLSKHLTFSLAMSGT